MTSPIADFEALIARLFPALPERCAGATPDAIARIERIAGRPLPAFYRWFLTRMGASMGPMGYATIDFSAARVLGCYDSGLVAPDPRHLLIGYETDESDPRHRFYDLDAPMRDDARVVERELEDTSASVKWETLREMLAWSAYLHHGLRTMPQRCDGSLSAARADLFDGLDAVMTKLGFEQPIATGGFCRLYARADAAMTLYGVPREDTARWRSFELSGPDTATLRSVLGAIAMSAQVEVAVRAWSPPLAE
ncbi:MAG: hypothetical protein U0326_32010 [Polyangiales bacterium]